MSTEQKRNMFPYRRPGHKKRPNRGYGHRNKGHQGGRRLPNAPRELLSMLQPTTKALAHMLAGKTKSSGQLVHARNVLEHAQRMVDERMVERMGPRDREEFLEQLARLKLTLADADVDADADEAPPQEEDRPKPPSIDPERLRALAMELTSPVPQTPLDWQSGTHSRPLSNGPGQDGSADEPGSTNGPDDLDTSGDRELAVARMASRAAGKRASVEIPKRRSGAGVRATSEAGRTRAARENRLSLKALKSEGQDDEKVDSEADTTAE